MGFKNSKVLESIIGSRLSKTKINAMVEYAILLFNGSGKDSINLQLINTFDFSEHSDNGFGTNANIGIFRKYLYDNASNTISITNPNNEVDSYEWNSNKQRYENLQLGSYIIITNNNPTLYYSNGISYQYDLTSSTLYPSKILKNGIVVYEITFKSTGYIDRIYANKNGDNYIHSVEFVYDDYELCSKMKVFYNQTNIFITSFIYDEDTYSYITRITYTDKIKNTTLYTKQFIINDTEIKCIDSLSNHSVIYEKTTNTINRIIEKKGNYIVDIKTITSDNIVSTMSPKLNYYFGDYLDLEWDYQGNFVFYEYDEKGRLTFVSDTNVTEYREDDLIENGYLENEYDGWSVQNGSIRLIELDEVYNNGITIPYGSVSEYLLGVQMESDYNDVTTTYTCNGNFKRYEHYSVWAMIAFLDLAPSSITLRLKMYKNSVLGKVKEKNVKTDFLNKFGVIAMEIESDDDYDRMDIEFYYANELDATLCLVGLQAFEMPLGTHITYDSNGKVIGYKHGKKVKTSNYEEESTSNIISSYSSTGNGAIQNSYSIKKKIKNRAMNVGVDNKINYEDDNERVKEEIIEGYSHYLKQSVTYSITKQTIASITNYANNTTSYTYEEHRYKNLLTLITDALGNSFKYEYNNYDLVKNFYQTVNSVDTVLLSYKYGTESTTNPNSFNYLSELIIKDGRKYYFIYDVAGRLIEIKLGNAFNSSISLGRYEYENKTNGSDIIYTSRVSKFYPTTGTSYYQYLYNNNNQTTSIKYYDGSTVSATLSFGYDSHHRLISVSEAGKTISYTYDSKNKIETVKEKDSSNQVIHTQKLTTDDNDNYVLDYYENTMHKAIKMSDLQQNVQRISNEHFGTYFRNKYPKAYACFFNEKDENGNVKASFYATTDGKIIRKPLAGSTHLELGYLYDNLFWSYAQGAGTSRHLAITYDVASSANTFVVAGWFKQTDNESLQTLTCLTNGYNDVITLQVKTSNAGLLLNINGETFSLNKNILTDKYNFFALSVTNNTAKLYLNNNVSEFILSSALSYQTQYVVFGGNVPINDYTNSFLGNLTALAVSDELFDIPAYYHITKQFIFANVDVEKPFASQVEYITDLDSLLAEASTEFYPLNNTLNSHNNKSPISYFSSNKEFSFIYDETLSKYVYHLFGDSKLIYSCSPTSGTITFRVKFDHTTANQTIMKLTTTQGQIVKLTRNASTKKVTLTVVGAVFTPDTVIEDDTWYTLGLSWMFGTTAAAQASNDDAQPYATYWNYTAQLIIDDNQALTSTKSTIRKAYTNPQLEISMDCTDIMTGCQIESLFITPSYYETTDLQNVIKTLSDTGYISRSRRNSLGLLVQKEYQCIPTVKEGETEPTPNLPIQIDYTLGEIVRDGESKSQLTGLITREEFMHNGTQRRYATYTYDALNRITQINDGDISSTYVYDTFGRLLQDRNTGKRYTYTYDDNGNILTKKYLVTTTNYTYDSTYKDKLIGYGSKTIKYTGIDDKYPTEYGEYQNNVLYNGEKYTWDRNRLVSITKVVNGVDQTPITYTYNVNGLRQSKTVNGNTTYFIYNNDLLVTQYDNSESYQFLYDENNMLFGFIRTDLTTNIKTQYFYIRRINGRIDGIMNASNGSIAVYYVCGAYGEIHQTYDYTTFGLGNKNPFRWMGYYYDVETNYYYCNSRYYNPEWGRWISPDSIEYLNVRSINGLNLYAYIIDPFALKSISQSGFYEIPNLPTSIYVDSIKFNLKLEYRFSYGIVTKEENGDQGPLKSDLFYVKGHIGVPTFKNGLDFVNIAAGVANVEYHFDYIEIGNLDVHKFAAIGVLNTNIEIDNGIDISFELISTEIGLVFNEELQVSFKVYLGAGYTRKIGYKERSFGGGIGVCYEISIESV